MLLQLAQCHQSNPEEISSLRRPPPRPKRVVVDTWNERPRTNVAQMDYPVLIISDTQVSNWIGGLLQKKEHGYP